ncbi:MAG: 23S rRNA (pseudouridine(1915)-N(3))-methyltransferase RlmH [Betaproteobacteria bacterium]|nr:23S rRNA (pseudouridine(1915)-N(3))-methyltransferase RlmH [Betaproteobacteria bacterium]
MKFVVVAVGHRMPAWINAGFNEYARRMPRVSRIELIEVKPATRSAGAKSVQQWLAAEARRIRAALPKSCFRAVLDARGKLLTTADIARRVERWKQDGRDVAFVIGGADGTADALQQESDLVLSLSPLTLPHGLCRILLAEQLYRAVSLLAGHPYHRE